MTQTVTLDLPTELVERAREVAQRTGRRFEDVLVGWMSGTESPAVEELPDAELLALCDSQLPEAEQQKLSELLEQQREGLLGETERARLAELLRAYRTGLVRKAQALRAAVARGLRSPLG
jgi:hypothetical protein